MGYTKQIEDTDSPQLPVNKKDKGDWGEQIAADYLITLGCAIRERKWRGRGFEIDIIAQKGTRIIFVEVKTRKVLSNDPVEAVDSTKRNHMIRGADIYLRKLNVPLDYQFDIIGITGVPHDYVIEHVVDAFFPSPRTRH